MERDDITDISTYMRSYSDLLGKRILQQFPALHQFGDPLSVRMDGLLRRPFPAQAIAIMGLTKRWEQVRTGMVVAECGTGKTLISLGAIRIHSEGRTFTALSMVSPHLVEKWTREAFSHAARVRVLILHAYRVQRSGPYFGCVVNSETGRPVFVDESRLIVAGFERVKIAESIEARGEKFVPPISQSSVAGRCEQNSALQFCLQEGRTPALHPGLLPHPSSKSISASCFVNIAIGVKEQIGSLP